MAGFDAFYDAIAGTESGGNYRAVNGRTGAMGKFQILPSNIGPWSKQYLGYSISPSQFLNSPQLQDKLARSVLQAQFNRYGAAGAASWWYSGSASNVDSTRSSHGEPSVAQYVQQVTTRMGGDYGYMAASTVDNRAKDSDLSDLLPEPSGGPTMDALAGVDRGGLGLKATDDAAGLEAAGSDALGLSAPEVRAATTEKAANKVTVADAAEYSTSQVAEGLAAAASGKWINPLGNAQRTSSYGMRNGRMHTGVDYAMAMRTPLQSMSDGVVTFAGQRGGKGNTVVIRYADGTESIYAHMDGFALKAGTRVSAGQVVGWSGNSGHSTGPHLHLEIQDAKGNTVDPSAWLRAQGLVK